MTQIPAELAEYGYVKAQVIRIIADTPADPDDLPDVVGAQGTIKLTPIEKNRRTVNHPAFVIQEELTCPLGPQGRMQAPDSTKTVVAVITGHYMVSMQIVGGTWGTFPVTVGPEHTQANPLDLASAAPYAPPSGGAPVVLMSAPPGGQPGQTLTPVAPGSTTLEWAGTVGVTGIGITQIEAITQAAYDALEAPDPATLYVIREA